MEFSIQAPMIDKGELKKQLALWTMEHSRGVPTLRCSSDIAENFIHDYVLPDDDDCELAYIFRCCDHICAVFRVEVKIKAYISRDSREHTFRFSKTVIYEVDSINNIDETVFGYIVTDVD